MCFADRLSRAGRLGLILVLSGCQGPPADLHEPDQVEVRDLRFFLRRLHQLDHLPLLEPAHTAMFSTWDREGGIRDGWCFDRIEGNRNVLLEVDGPGCIHRIFTGHLGPILDHTRIQIFLDHSQMPTFDLPLNQFFSEKDGPFPVPLVGIGTYPGVLFPIPFARHCRIQVVNDQPYKHWGIVWQITYSTYPDGTPVKSLSWPPDTAAQQELELVVGRWLVADKLPPQPPERWTIDRVLPLAAGARSSIRLDGCQVIRQLRIAVSPDSPELLRSIRLQIRWDGHPEPSVDLPVGYFFGHGDVGRHPSGRYSSLVMGVTAEEAYSLLPMPFARGAIISFYNRSAEMAAHARVKLDLSPCHDLPGNWGRFHATWRQRPAVTVDSPRVGPLQMPGHLVLERTGRGKLVGTLIHLFWPHLFAWWGEGDWLIWSDEQGWPPSYHGTGSEEYFNSGWMFLMRRAVSGHVSTRPGPVAAYAFHLNDAFSFEHSIRVIQETSGSFGGEEIIHTEHPLWGSTAFWYALPAQGAGSDPW